MNRGARKHKAVVVLRPEAPAGEVRRRARRGERLVDRRNATGIDECCDACAGT